MSEEFFGGLSNSTVMKENLQAQMIFFMIEQNSTIFNESE
jgi:hypothetical protein